MKRTGIFFLYLIGERLSDFPEELAGILDRTNISFYEAFYELTPTPEELLLKVHSPQMIYRVKQTVYYETALYSTGGTVQAAERIWRNEIGNAFVFTGTGDHHAGRDYFGKAAHIHRQPRYNHFRNLSLHFFTQANIVGPTCNTRRKRRASMGRRRLISPGFLRSSSRSVTSRTR